jgi:D-amino peptidase
MGLIQSSKREVQPMRILLSVDMEGVTGVTNWDQVTPGHAEYARFRRLMTADVNAAVRGALEAGVDEVVVTDAHWNASNILIEELDPRARLNSGTPSPGSMMQGIGAAIDGVFFVGYHARHGTPNAVLDHTWSSTCVHGVWLNHIPAGEYTMNAALAGHHHVPILLVTGDEAVCNQVAELLGPVKKAVVKRAAGRFSAACLPPESTQQLIHAAAKEAVLALKAGTSPNPFFVQTPIEIEVELQTSDMADQAALMPGIRREGLRMTFSASDMPQAFSTFRSLISLSYPR